MQQELMNEEETMVEIKENFSTIQDEVEHKTKKLNKVAAVFKFVPLISSICPTFVAAAF